MKVFHNPEICRIDILDERFYKYSEDVYFPSVTTILSYYPKGSGLDDWIKAVGFNADIILDRAATLGTNVHNACEAYLNGKEIIWIDESGKENYTLEEWRLITKFVTFWQQVKPELLACEMTMAVPELQIGGTLDILCRINGKVWVLDIKTSNGLYESYDLQLSAYAKMVEVINPQIKVDNVGLLWLKASTRTEKIDHDKQVYQGIGWQLKSPANSIEYNWKLFQHCYSIWKHMNPNYKPANKFYPDRFKLDGVHNDPQ